jgi:hypothetical protein
MTHFKQILTGLNLAVIALVASGGGCVKRAEFIAVLPDGRIELITGFSGDKDDILGPSDATKPAGDPAPSSAAGWNVVTKDVQEKDQTKTTLIATMSLAPGTPLPTTYAAPNSPVAPAATRFTTHISLEESSDGTYYHFKRTYARRRWAPFEYHRKQILESDDIKKLMENDPKSMTEADRKIVIDALVAVETEQQVELLDFALAGAGEGISQLAQLAAIKRVREITSQHGLGEKIMQALMSSNGAQNSTELEMDLHDRIDTAVNKALIDAGTERSIASATAKALQGARRDFQVSKDLEDESWNVQVVLPGKIIAYNGKGEPESIDPAGLDKIGDKNGDDPADDAAIILATKLKPFVDSPGFQNYSWSFKFDALLDRDVVLMATSFVPKK